MNEHSGSPHVLKNPNKLINLLEKQNFIDQFNNFKKREQQYKASLLKVLKNITSSFEKIISEVNKRISLINSHILHIKANNFILLQLESSCLDNQVLTEKDVRIYLNSIRTTHDIQSICRESIMNLEESSESFDVNDAIYYINHNSNDLIEVDLSSFNTKIIPLQLHNEELKSPAVVRVDELKLFIHGGYDNHNRSSPFTYYLDLMSLNLQKLPTYPGRSDSMGLKVSNRIFLFGGLQNHIGIKSSAYFDTRSCKWETIKDLPCPVYHTCQMAIDDESILISGCPQNLLNVYVILTNEYLSLEANLEFDHRNILIKFEDVVFLLSKQFFKTENLQYWEKIGFSQTDIGVIATNPVIRNEFAYFVNTQGTVFQFNCRDYGIGVIVCSDQNAKRSFYDSIRK